MASLTTIHITVALCKQQLVVEAIVCLSAFASQAF